VEEEVEVEEEEEEEEEKEKEEKEEEEKEEETVRATCPCPPPYLAMQRGLLKSHPLACIERQKRMSIKSCSLASSRPSSCKTP
jgi:hypothetical protein